jgi:hypothetical protein
LGLQALRNLARGSRRILRTGDRSADDQNGGAVVKRLSGRNYPFLIAWIGTGRSDSRDHKEAVGPPAASIGNFGAGANDPVHT